LQPQFVAHAQQQFAIGTFAEFEPLAAGRLAW